MPTVRGFAAVGTALVAVAALGISGCSSNSSSSGSSSTEASTALKTIDISMVDNAYQPATPITVAKGDKVKFVFHNAGKVPHEAVLGDAAAQDAHEQEMMQSGGMGGMGGMNHGATHADSVDVAAGKTASLTHRFDTAGQVIIGCHYPGHFTSMHIPVTVS